jgi:hypothetical protein
MFLLLVLPTVFLVIPLIPVLPYFTLGEDLKMAKELGYDILTLLSGVFVVICASTSISDEIEGRTAITLMSKPVSRWQFLIGKFVGILLAGGVLVTILGWFVVWMFIYKEGYDPKPGQVEKTPDPGQGSGQCSAGSQRTAGRPGARRLFVDRSGGRRLSGAGDRFLPDDGLARHLGGAGDKAAFYNQLHCLRDLLFPGAFGAGAHGRVASKGPAGAVHGQCFRRDHAGPGTL